MDGAVGPSVISGPQRERAKISVLSDRKSAAERETPPGQCVQLRMSDWLLWSSIPASPHHPLSPEKCCHNSALSFTPPPPPPYLSLLLSPLFLHHPIFPPLPPTPLCPPCLCPPTPSVRLCCLADMRWHIVWRMCVCVRACVCVCVCECLSGLRLIRRLTLILLDRPVLLWRLAGHTQLHILHTRIHFNTYMHSLDYVPSCRIESFILELLLLRCMCVYVLPVRYLIILSYKTLSLSASLAESLLTLCTGVKTGDERVCAPLCFSGWQRGCQKGCLIENTCHEKVNSNRGSGGLLPHLA